VGGYGQGICIAQYLNSATPFGASGPASSLVSASANGGTVTPFPSTSGFPTGTTCNNAVLPASGAQFFGPNLFSAATEGLTGSRTDTDVISVNVASLGAQAYSGQLFFIIGAM
jgi:hypothetical protein